MIKLFKWILNLFQRGGFDIANAVRNGVLFIRDGDDLFDWQPHFFVLTESKMFYSEMKQEEDQVTFKL